MSVHQSLSSRGSDRATAYNMSNKVVRLGQDLYVTWLEAPQAPGAPTRALLGRFDLQREALVDTLVLGPGIDNHCGAALALDGEGRLHAIVGAHHGSFLYRWSSRPEDAGSWTEPEQLGPRDTYPSLAIDGEGTLHLAHREQGERWQLWYRRRRAGGGWEPPRALAVSPTPGYNHFMQRLTVGPTGALHLTFQFHYAESGRAIDCEGRAAVYLCSPDGGDTWYNEGTRRDDLPLTVDGGRAICRYPGGGVRIGNHVVDAQDRVWLFSILPDTRGGVLWRRDDDGWVALDLQPAWPGLDLSGPRSSSLARDGSGRLHLVVAADPSGQNSAWHDPRHELHHLVLDRDGNALSVAQVTDSDPTVARWLPALAQWAWGTEQGPGTEGPFLLYTAGLNAGGIGGDNRNVVTTGVRLCRPQ